jgi:hypothetical protein
MFGVDTDPEQKLKLNPNVERIFRCSLEAVSENPILERVLL